MRPEIKERWIAALRDGKRYPQGRGALRTIGAAGDGVYGSGVLGYCCLGVLCAIAREDGVGDWESPNSPYFRDASDDAVTAARSATELTPDVAEWAGLSDPSPGLGTYTAIHWNDEEEASFEKIAELVEAHL